MIWFWSTLYFTSPKSVIPMESLAASYSFTCNFLVACSHAYACTGLTDAFMLMASLHAAHCI